MSSLVIQKLSPNIYINSLFICVIKSNGQHGPMGPPLKYTIHDNSLYGKTLLFLDITSPFFSAKLDLHFLRCFP